MHKLKLLIIVIFFLNFGLSSCRINPTVQEENQVKALDQLLTAENFPSEWYHLLSPDGKWLIKGPFGHKDPFQIISTNSPNEKIQIDAIDEIGWSQGNELWSRDGSTVAALGLQKPGKCEFDRIILYHINSSLKFDRYIYQFLYEKPNCFSMDWSPDSTKIAVRVGDYIYILDNKAQLIQKILIQPKGTLWLRWPNDSIFATIENSDHTELWRISLSSSKAGQEMLFSQKNLFSIIAFDPLGKKILLLVRSQTYNEPNNLWVLDMQSQELIQEISLPGQIIFDPSASPVSTLVGMAISKQNQSQPTLYVYDWKNGKLIEFGNISYFIGWRSNVNGFLTITESSNKFSLNIIRP